MPSVLTDDGQDAIADRFFGRASAEGDIIAVGTGTSQPTDDDTSLDSNVFEASESSSVVDISQGSAPGEYVCRITVGGGTEIPGDTTLTEFALKTDAGGLVYREVRTGVTVDDGERVTFQFSVDLTN